MHQSYCCKVWVVSCAERLGSSNRQAKQRQQLCLENQRLMPPEDKNAGALTSSCVASAGAGDRPQPGGRLRLPVHRRADMEVQGGAEQG